ncbi:unnamed protein product, partial [Ectocarpus fasciculatus]
IKQKNNKLVIYFPSYFYDALNHLCYPLNYLISNLCHILPTRNSIWSEPGFEKRNLGLPTINDLATVRNDILVGKDVAYDETKLVALYDSLPAVSAEGDLIGRTWNGRVLRTNWSVLDIPEWLLIRPLGLLGFSWGKRYLTQHTGDPLLVRWMDTIYFPLPVWGNVGMVDIRWRGVCTATMNYDYQPWKDYFRLLSNENGKVVLLGVWTNKAVAGGWFILTLDPNVPTV